MTTVATLTFTETGQSVGLLQDTTLILGRNTFVGVTSPHIIQLTSKGDEITITNLGTNRSSLNGKALSNDTPSKVKDSDVITLIEDKFRVLIHLNSDSSPAQDKSTRKEFPVGIASSGNTSSPLKPPPAFPRSAPPSKKPEPPTATTTTGTTERPKTGSPSASRAPAASTTINAIISTTATTANPVDINLTRAQDPINIPHNYKDTIHRMEIVDDSENTSDSDKEDAMDVDARSSDISAESSFICEDLTDSGNGSDSDDGH
ncbi:hypothetical protein EC957_005252 [Mortierella hygrophila]|uniref:FHA domain-containing protein n=1 Tax=Mortierella hygrophila TaxID=979708 RepID=A0A9P6K6N7_9FUNG|nr:hypothetical protein EC957_005252 [Mortierella hygrophila]